MNERGRAGWVRASASTLLLAGAVATVSWQSGASYTGASEASSSDPPTPAAKWAAGTSITQNSRRPNYAYRGSACDDCAGRFIVQWYSDAR